jgi:hypothetical protein
VRGSGWACVLGVAAASASCAERAAQSDAHRAMPPSVAAPADVITALRRFAPFSTVLADDHGAWTARDDGSLRFEARDPRPAFSARATHGSTAGHFVPATDAAHAALVIEVGHGPTSATRLSTRAAADGWIEIAPVLTFGANAERSIVGNATVDVGAREAEAHVQAATAERFEDWVIVRAAGGRIELRERLAFGPAIVGARVADGAIEAIDHEGRVRWHAEAPFAIDDRGVRAGLDVRIEASDARGATLVLSLDGRGLADPIAIDPVWSATTDFPTLRWKQGALPLPTGGALIFGGWTNVARPSETSTSYAFVPSTASWMKMNGFSGAPESPVVTPLSTGKFLVSGGNTMSVPSRSAMLYDPTTDGWSSAGSTGTPYVGDVTARISGDRVLAVGLASNVMLWSPSTSSFAAAGTLTGAFSAYTASGLPDDRVIVVGGSTTDTAVWDPKTMTFGSGPPTTVPRSAHTATTLASGKVLFVGGTGGSSAELFDPTTNTFVATDPMSTARTGHTATLLSTGRVLVVGGTDGSGAPLSSAELFDVASGHWSSADAMAHARSGHTATLLAADHVLIVGGTDAGGTPLSSAEIFAPYVAGVACVQGGECASGFCVDGVCCDRACTGQCEACDVSGSVGTCATVRGAPHGTRSVCAAGGDPGCGRACDGSDATACHFATSATTCVAASCAAGVATSNVSCDGAGHCAAPTMTDCAPYACGASACKTACASDADCGGANVCETKSGTCAPAIAQKCSADRSTSIPTDPTKPAVQCAPYLCDPSTGRCLSACATSADCASGTTCVTATGVCATAAPTTSGGGGGADAGGSVAGPTTSSGGGCATGRSVGANDARALGAFACAALITLARRATSRRKRVSPTRSRE